MEDEVSEEEEKKWIKGNKKGGGERGGAHCDASWRNGRDGI